MTTTGLFGPINKRFCICQTIVLIFFYSTMFSLFIVKALSIGSRITHKADCPLELHLFISTKHPHLPPL